MIVDGYTAEVRLDGEFSAAVQWQAFALDKLRQMIRSGFRGQRVLRMGDVKLRVWMDPATKRARVWVEAGVAPGRAIALYPAQIEFNPNLGYDTASRVFGKPYTDAQGDPINAPLGTLNGQYPYWLTSPEFPKDWERAYAETGEIKYQVTKSPPGEKKTDLKWGANDWVHYKTTGEGAAAQTVVAGYLTWGRYPGRGIPASREAPYSGMESTEAYAPALTNAPSFAGTTAPKSVYYNGKETVKDTPGSAVVGAAIRTIAGVEWVLGVSTYDTNGVQFNLYEKTFSMPLGFVMWRKNRSTEDPAETLGYIYPASPLEVFDPTPLFAFNRSATKCSAVVRMFAPTQEPDAANSPFTSLAPVVYHVDWANPAAPVASNEGYPEDGNQHVDVVVTGNGNTDEPEAWGESTTTSSTTYPQYTLAIDYKGDVETRLTWTGSNGSVRNASESSNSLMGQTSADLTASWASSYSVDGVALTSSSRTQSSASSMVSASGHVTMSDSTSDFRSEAYIAFLDLRYPLIVWYDVVLNYSATWVGVPGLYYGMVTGDWTRNTDVTYTLHTRFGDNTSSLTPVVTSRSLVTTRSQYVPQGTIWGYVPSTDSYDVSDLYAFPLAHESWLGYQLNGGVYNPTNIAYYRRYIPQVSGAALVGDETKATPDSSVVSIAYRPLKAGGGGEILWDYAEQLYTYSSRPDGFKPSAQLDLQYPHDFVHSVGIGR